MFARLIAFWRHVRDSLWGLPLAMALAGGALALAVLSVNVADASKFAWLYSGSARQAPDFAASLVGAMITLTALAFSLTMIVLALAAQQLGPRLIQIFMQDRSTQSVLGLFLATVVYLLLVLRSLDGDPEGQAPNLAITGGTGLVLASVLALLFFVHALARSIVSDNVIARVGTALDHAVDRAFILDGETEDAATPEGGECLYLKTHGYVQGVDYAGLVDAACEAEAQIVLAYRAGDHVLDGEADARILGAEPEKLRRAVSRAVIFGSARAEGQDPEWSARQLVEVGLRALSPGINDAFTALAAIDRLSQSLALLLKRGACRQVWRDKDGRARVFGPAPTFALMIDEAFDQLREAGAGNSGVLLRLAENLAKLAALAHDAERRTAIAAHLTRLEHTAQRQAAIAPDGAGAVLARIADARATLQRQE